MLSSKLTLLGPSHFFNSVRIQTNIVFADARSVHFRHVFSVCGVTYANVVVKAKFKAGRITQSAVELTRFDGQTILPVQADLSVSAEPQSAE